MDYVKRKRILNGLSRHITMWCFKQFGTIVQFQKREKHPRKSVSFIKETLFLKETLHHGC